MAQATDTSLRLERTYQASCEKVFTAWTEKEALSRWFAPTPEYQVRVTALDPKPGGAYRIEMQRPDGGVSVAHGRYEEVTAPSRLVFTWGWEEHPDWGESRVTVELFAADGATRLVLTHDRLADRELRDSHEKGWIGCLDQLDRAL